MLKRSISAGTLLIYQASRTQKHKRIGEYRTNISQENGQSKTKTNKKEGLEKEKGHFVNNMWFLIQVTNRGKFTFKNYVSQNSWKVLFTPNNKLASNHNKKKRSKQNFCSKKINYIVTKFNTIPTTSEFCLKNFPCK